MRTFVILSITGYLYAGQSSCGKTRWTRKYSECWETRSFQCALKEMLGITDRMARVHLVVSEPEKPIRYEEWKPVNCNSGIRKYDFPGSIPFNAALPESLWK